MTNEFFNDYADSKVLRLLTGFICFSLLFLLPVHALAAAASPTGASIPAVTAIVDASGAEWTVSDGVIYKDGALAGFSKGVAKLLYLGGVIYQENASGNWWSWSGATWVKAVNNPLSPSPNGASIPTVGLIIDATGSVWTVSGGVIYKDGALAGFSKGVVELLYKNGIFYQENAAQKWWSWNGVGWTTASNPVPPPPVNGSCGASNNASFSTAPTGNLCTMGTATTVTGNGPWTWGCVGANGGTSQSCQANLIVNGSCGASNNANVITAPSSNLCTTGIASAVTGAGPWAWSCAGANGGTSQSCQANLIVNGSCGTSNNANVITAPSSNLCTTGIASAVTGAGPWAWSCAGTNGGTSQSCQANLIVNGSCGASNNANVITAPSSNLCTTGIASAVTGAGPWAWSCAGANGGTSQSCQANLIVNGSCGTSNNANVITAPSSNLCTTGIASAVTGAGPWAWSCAGTNGGTSQSCQDNLIVNGSCGASNNASFSTAPTGNLCTKGTATTVTGNGPWTWWCAGANGGTNQSCQANLIVNGSCGASNNASFSTAPSGNLCTMGTATTVTGNGPWAWNCVGSKGGKNASCTAFLETQSRNTDLAGTKLGINIGGAVDYDPQMIFVDVVKDARTFSTSISNGTPVPVDANGWPTTDFQTVFLTAGNDPLGRTVSGYAPSMAGTYSLSFTGQATVGGVGCCQIENVNYDSATNTTTADVVVSPTGKILALKFTNTNNGVQDIHLLRPGYPRGTTQIFTTQFLNAIAPFGALRFMDTLVTNSSTVTSWAERTQPSAPSQAASNTGVAWEYLIELANETGKDIWINIPEGVDLTDPTSNNYVIQLAQLLQSTLNPALHVYVEYSNELWNTEFSQTFANHNSAISEVESGADTTLNYDGSKNDWYWAYRRIVHQIFRISQLFAKVYGQGAINTTIRPVYEFQFVQPSLAADGLAYMKAELGEPSQYIYGTGGAGYYGPSSKGGPYTSEPGVIAATQTALLVTEKGFEPSPYINPYTKGLTYKGLANHYGLKYTAYEGGPSLSNYYASTLINEQAESDPMQPAMIESEMAQFFGCGGDLFMYYTLAEGPGNVFGALEDLSIMTPKYNALLTVTKTPLADYNTCQ